MQRHIRPQLILNPPAHGSHLVHVVILTRYHQINDLSMNTQTFEPFKCLQHGLQGSLSDFSIVRFVKALQIDAGRVQIFTQFLKRGRVDVAIGVHDLQQPLLLGQHSNIYHVLCEHSGFHIGGGDGLALVTAG